MSFKQSKVLFYYYVPSFRVLTLLTLAFIVGILIRGLVLTFIAIRLVVPK